MGNNIRVLWKIKSKHGEGDFRQDYKLAFIAKKGLIA